MISSPASSGSSLSIRCNAASPPPNSSTNSRLKWPLTISNEVKSRSRASRLRALDALAQPLDGFHQIVAFGGERGVLGFDLAQFFLARRLTAPSRSRSRRSFSRFSSISGSGGNSAPGSISASSATRCGSTSSMSWISRFDIDQPAPRTIHALFGAGAGFARARQRFERNLGARSVSAITFSAAASVSAATRRALSADSISLISARRFSANNAGALSSSARSALTS